MAVFEPDVVRNWCLSMYSGAEQVKQSERWISNVTTRWTGWRDKRIASGQSVFLPQLVWVAETCEYVNFLAKLIRPPAKSGVSSVPLNPNIPLLGPRFIPPSFLHVQRRNAAPEITPDPAYLKPVTIVHPVYYPDVLDQCPRCRMAGLKSDIAWNGWNPTGHREVHGLMQEETAIGVQLRCKVCEVADAQSRKGQTNDLKGETSCRKSGRKGEKKAGGEEVEESANTGYCFVTTSHRFWEKVEHWDLPLGVPHFFKRCALTQELYDLIVELRPSVTAAGLAENVRQLHLLHYHKQRLAYLKSYYATRPRGQLKLGQQRTGIPLRNFSNPETSGVATHVAGYDNRSISDDLISDVFSKFSQQTRQAESEESLRSKTAVTISLDATFRAAYKSTIVEKDKTRTKPCQGGIVTVINEDNLIINWRYCHSQAHVEVENILKSTRDRFRLLGVADPEMAVVDNCCHIKNAILAAFPHILVVLDLWHFMMRYLICIVNGTKNPKRAAVARDLSGAIVKSTANGKVPAVYWSQAEQEERLKEVFEKWSAEGGVWSAAAEKTHVEQLGHVQKGCLARPRNDIRSDGSRIEGVHKGFNSLQRSFASGLLMMIALLHDYILRRNVRIEFASAKPTPFIVSTHGSHHVRLVNACARSWNALINAAVKRGDPPPADIHPLPELLKVDSGESFGLVKMSPAVAAQQSFATIKDEPDDGLDFSAPDLLDAAHVLGELGIDPALLHLPLPQAPRANVTVDRGVLPDAVSVKSPGASPPKPRLRQAMVPHPSPSQEEQRDVRPDQVILQIDGTSHTGKGKGVDRSQAIGTKRPRVEELSGLIEMTEDDWQLEAITQRSGALSLDQSAFASSSPALSLDRSAFASSSPVLSLDRSTFALSLPTPTDTKPPSSPAPAVPVRAPIFSQVPMEFPHLPVSLHTVAGAAEPPPKKKARLYVAGTPGPSSSTRQPSASLHGLHRISSTQGAAAGTTSNAAGSSADTTAARLSSFFAPRRPEFHANSSVRPCVPAPTITGATRSQQVFSIATGIDPRTLSFAGASGKEFFLFMDLRERYKWASFNMSPFDWVTAASVYNQELEAMNARDGRAFIKKTPRALMEHLGKTETKILSRLATSNFKSKESGKTEFWTRHCHAVSLGTKSQVRGELNGKKQTRFNHMCSRCQKLMYPGGTGASINHKKAFCSDGARQSSRTVDVVINGQSTPIVDEPPPYPQPAGIFSSGSTFHPVSFLQEVRVLYERVIEQKDAVTMQDLAFAKMLYERTLMLPASDNAPAMALFKLFPSLNIEGTFSQHLLVQYEGVRYLRIDYLGDPAQDVPY